MRLYTRTGATALDDARFGHFDAGPDGCFDVPEEFGEELRRFHLGGRAAWETDIERQHRLMAEELERRKDPATLLAAVEQIVAAAAAVTPSSPPAAAKTAKARKAADPTG